MFSLPVLVPSALAATAEEKCINALNKDFWKAPSARAKGNATCMKDAQTGQLGLTTAQDCLELDRKGKVDKSIVKASVDVLAGEECEDDNDCSAGDVCGNCECGPPLGSWFFNVAAGSSANCPADSPAVSFLKGRGLPTGGLLGTIRSITRGNFRASANFELVSVVTVRCFPDGHESAASRSLATMKPNPVCTNVPNTSRKRVTSTTRRTRMPKLISPRLRAVDPCHRRAPAITSTPKIHAATIPKQWYFWPLGSSRTD
ncbi:MAG: hypothetical protein P8R42_06915 [Candidatus Binatia bacterium]|nr:hypothetical protein [Candidatus Binatia bacterium]